MTSKKQELVSKDNVQPLPAAQALNPETLIAKAIEHNLNVEGLERLLAMRERLKAESAKEAYFRALSEFQAECPVIRKKKSVMNRDGQSVRYKYAPLDDIVDQCRKQLKAHGLSYTIQTEYLEQAIKAVCTVHHVAGHSEASEFTAPIDREARMNDMQKTASAQTYAKRYAFCNALGILTGDEDDDGGALDSISEKDHRRIEALIAKYGLDRDGIKNWLKERGVDHVNDMPKPIYNELDKALPQWALHNALDAIKKADSVEVLQTVVEQIKALPEALHPQARKPYTDKMRELAKAYKKKPEVPDRLQDWLTDLRDQVKENGKDAALKILHESNLSADDQALLEAAL